MKYYLIAGEASGDLHASQLMKAIAEADPKARFRYFGGDLMKAQGGECVTHYRELAYMGFVPVLLHLRTILAGMRRCKQDIVEWQPDVVILVDYPGFNLKIARFLHAETSIPVCYYISPKIWAWKEYRIKSIRRDINLLLSILPFEKPFFEEKHHYPITYVGNPTVDEVAAFRKHYCESAQAFKQRHRLDDKPLIALLAGSRKQEIKDNLPLMLKAVAPFTDRYQPVLACAPGIDDAFYAPFVEGSNLRLVRDETYPLLSHARAALVTSGTATLETALFRVPQAVCYYTPVGRLISFLKRHLLSVEYISLVNLIADAEVVQELVAHRMTVANIQAELTRLLTDEAYVAQMQQGYDEVLRRLGPEGCPRHAAEHLIGWLNDNR